MSGFAAALPAGAGDRIVATDAAGRGLESQALSRSRLAPALGVRPYLALSIRDPLDFLRLLVAGDADAKAMLLLSPDLSPEDLDALAGAAGCGTLISDRTDLAGAVAPDVALTDGTGPVDGPPAEWIMTTSGTTGLPKLVRHTLAGLSRTVRPWRGEGSPPVWGLLFEPTRFAGLQVVLQATLSGGILVAPDPRADFGTRLEALARAGCTHLSGTSTLWRRILMHPGSRGLALRQITLGGEIADQPVLDALRARFPDARLTHVYASTEAGVGFSVQDGREGFPRAYLETGAGGVALKLADGRLWLRAPGDPTTYLGAGIMERDPEAFLDTTDRVEVRGDRVVFLGRAGGAINVGGAKVHPETVERVLLSVPGVALAQVLPRRNPISGFLLTAQVVPSVPPADPAAFRTEIIRICREVLPPEARPATVTLCDSLDTNAAGKLTRR